MNLELTDSQFWLLLVGLAALSTEMGQEMIIGLSPNEGKNINWTDLEADLEILLDKMQELKSDQASRN